MNVTIGADPEFFIRPIVKAIDLEVAPQKAKNKINKKSPLGVISEVPQPEVRPEWIPVCGLLGGTKQQPMQIPGLPKGFMHQEDGAAVEFNVPVSTSAGEFDKSIRRAFNALVDILNTKGFTPTSINTINLTDAVLEKHPHLEAVGCDPDYNVYEKTPGLPRGPIPSKYARIRGAGGHLHIGYDKNRIPHDVLVKLLDLVLCLPTLKYDSQPGRRSWWGQPGIYRPKPYGIEYRTLSNWWLFNPMNSAVAHTIFDLMTSLHENMDQWQAVYNLTNWDSLKLIVYAEDVKGAHSFLENLTRGSKVLSSLIGLQHARGL